MKQSHVWWIHMKACVQIEQIFASLYFMSRQGAYFVCEPLRAYWLSSETMQGTSVDIGGYFRPDAAKVKAAMQPSTTLNTILAAFWVSHSIRVVLLNFQ